MRTSLLLASLAPVAVLAAPAYPQLNVVAGMPGSEQSLSSYFNMLAQKVLAYHQMSSTPMCDLSMAKLPSSIVSPSLPPPSEGLRVKHVAIGRGTQNYTCDVNNATAVPVAVGALATLFNASCIAATYPDLLNLLPHVVLAFNLTENAISALDTRLFPSNLVVSGHHFFSNATTPVFDLNTPTAQLGKVALSKNNTEAAPPPAAANSDTDNRGQLGESAVAWLKLVSKPDPNTVGNLQEVYRVQTAGGNPPATCVGSPAAFEIQYAAQYWFYERSS